MRRTAKTLTAFLLAGVASAALSVGAQAADKSTQDDRDAKIKALEEKIETLGDQVQDLKRSTADQYADSQRQQNEAVKVTLDNGRPSFKSGDGNFSASLRALVQYDTAFYSQNNSTTAKLTPALGRDLSDGTRFRRAQFGLEGTFFKTWSYSFIYDFGGSNGTEQQGRVSSAYVQYNGLAPFQFRIGAFAPYIGLEDSTSSADLLFPERPTSSELSRSLTGGDGRKGAQIAAVGDEYLFSVSYTGASTTAASVFDDQQSLNARAAYLFYSDLDTKLVGSLSGVYLFDTPDSVATAIGPTSITLADRPELRVDGTQLITAAIDADNLLIGGAEAALQWHSAFLQGGYFVYDIQRRASALPDPRFNGWYVEGSWILTGEAKPYDATRAAFRSPKPSQPLDFGDTPGIGAWELAGRFSTADLNYHANFSPAAGGVRGGEQKIWSLALNWYPNNSVRLAVDYEHVEIDRRNPTAIAASAPYPAVPAGADIGQTFSAVNLRAQIAL
ncbi:MAG: porin [Proteobacteria bacterium]|nr:porin [Pseudomonadota bacterium]